MAKPREVEPRVRRQHDHVLYPDACGPRPLEHAVLQTEATHSELMDLTRPALDGLCYEGQLLVFRKRQSLLEAVALP